MVVYHGGDRLDGGVQREERFRRGREERFGIRQPKRGRHSRTGPRQQLLPSADITLMDCSWDPTKGPCCKKKCNQLWDPVAVQSLRRACSQAGRDSYERGAFINARHYTASYGATRQTYHLDHPDILKQSGPKQVPQPGELVPCCQKFFKWSLAVSGNLIHGTRQSPRQVSANGQVFRKRVRDEPKWTLAKRWLVEESYVADKQPDNDHCHLPFSNRAAVHRSYVNHLDMRNRGDSISQKYFLKGWRTDKETKHIKVRKWMRFAQCTVCLKHREKRDKERNKEERRILDLAFLEHVRDVKRERGGYYLRRRNAVEHPDDSLSLIIDGADQSKFHLPYHREVDHRTQGKFKIKLHVHGLLSHGRDAMAYFCPPYLKQGANSTIEIIHRYVTRLTSGGATLPPVLFLQLDNTARQNKNKYLIGYLGLLVHYGVFTTILLSFLPVGHTHEDIDQFFSCIAKALYLEDSVSRIALKRIIEAAFTMKRDDTVTGKRVPVRKVAEPAAEAEGPATDDEASEPQSTSGVTAENMDLCANISEFLEPHVKKVDSISKYFQFRIWVAGRGDQRQPVYARRGDSHMDGRRQSQYQGKTEYSLHEPIFNNTPETKLFLDQPPFEGVPDAQHETERAAGEREDDLAIRLGRKTKAKRRLESDINKQIAEHDYDPEEVTDLRAMLRNCLLDPTELDLAFHWDTTIYTRSFTALRARVAKTPSDSVKLLMRLSQKYPVSTPIAAMGSELQDDGGSKPQVWFGKILSWLIKDAEGGKHVAAEVHFMTETNESGHKSYTYDVARHVDRSVLHIWPEAIIEGYKHNEWFLPHKKGRSITLSATGVKARSYYAAKVALEELEERGEGEEDGDVLTNEEVQQVMEEGLNQECGDLSSLQDRSFSNDEDGEDSEDSEEHEEEVVAPKRRRKHSKKKKKKKEKKKKKARKT
jgi:hypothetical protein